MGLLTTHPTSVSRQAMCADGGPKTPQRCSPPQKAVKDVCVNWYLRQIRSILSVNSCGCEGSSCFENIEYCKMLFPKLIERTSSSPRPSCFR
eukprot:1180674-Prorocentrum_minimum.AAC.1